MKFHTYVTVAARVSEADLKNLDIKTWNYLRSSISKVGG